MEKKKAIKIATATAIAASAFAAVAPTQSEAATSIPSQIKTAKAAIKKPYDTYIKATTKPATYTTVKSQLDAAKKAKTNINAAIKKAKLTTKQKNAYYAQVKAYDVYITRAQNYVNALSISVVGAKTQLATAIASGTDADKLAKQKALKTKIAQFKTAVAKVYGKNVRSLLLSYYVTPAQKLVDSVVFEVKIESVSALDATNKYLQINFSNPVKSLSPSNIQVKSVKKGDIAGVKAVTLASDGKSAQVELLSNSGDGGQVLEKNTEYTVTVNVNGKAITGTFFDAQFEESRVSDIDVQNQKFTITNDKTGSSVTLKVVDGFDFDYQAALGEKVRVWYNDDQEVVKYQIADASAKYDAIKIDKVDEVKLLSTGKNADLSKEQYSNDEKKVAFYLNGKQVDLVNGKFTTNGTEVKVGDKFNFAKIGYDKSGDIEYISAYTLKDFLVVDHVEGNTVVGIKGDTSGSFDAVDATVIKNGKSVALSALSKGDVLFFNNDADSTDGYAEVLNKTVTGKIETVYNNAVKVNGTTYKFDYDADIATEFGYSQQAVYLDQTELKDVDSDAAEELQAAGPVTLYLDYAGNLIYISGDTANVPSNSKSAVLTKDIVADTTFNKGKVQLETLRADGKESIFDVTLENLKTISVNGKDYDIDNTSPSASEWKVAVKDLTADGVTAYTHIVLSNLNATTAYEKEMNIPLAKAGALVDLKLDDNNNLKELAFFDTTVLNSGDEGTVVSSEKLEAGDKYFVGNKSYQLKDSTVVFDASTETDFDAADMKVTTWGQYKGSDIPAKEATAIYNNDNEVVALVINNTDADSTVEEEVIVTDLSRNVDKEIVEITGYVNGTKKTFKVDKVKGLEKAEDLQKGDVAVLEFDKDNTDLVTDVFVNKAIAGHNILTHPKLSASYVVEQLVVDKVDVGQKKVTFKKQDGTSAGTYTLANNGLVLNGTDNSDIKVKALSDLVGKKNVTVVLDEKGDTFAKFFVYEPENGAPTPTPTPTPATQATIDSPYVFDNLSDELKVSFTKDQKPADYSVLVYEGSTLVTTITDATRTLNGEDLGLLQGVTYTVKVQHKTTGSILVSKDIVTDAKADFEAPTVLVNDGGTNALTKGEVFTSADNVNITVTSTGETSEKVTLDGVDITTAAVGSGYAIATNGTKDGQHTLTYTVSDDAGNIVTDTITFKVDALVTATDFGPYTWGTTPNTYKGYSVGFKLNAGNAKALPIEKIEVSLLDNAGAVIATNVSKNALEGFDGATLSSPFESTGQFSDEYWTYGAWSATGVVPAKAVITVTYIDGSTHKAEKAAQ